MKSPKVEVQARVVRYDLAKLRLGQVVVPLAMISGIGARHYPNPVTALLAFGLMGVALYTMLKARTRMGAQPLTISRDKIRVGSSGFVIERECTARWFVDGDTARFYEPDVTWKITAAKREAEQLRAGLASFGELPALTRRGSVLARTIAFTIGAFGLLAVTYGWFNNADGMVVFGLLPTMLGFTTMGVLFQKVVPT